MIKCFNVYVDNIHISSENFRVMLSHELEGANACPIEEVSC